MHSAVQCCTWGFALPSGNGTSSPPPAQRYNLRVSKPRELDWDDLRYFLRAAHAKTLAGAARALKVEHTTIGRRLSALERAFGAKIFIRGPDGLRLTAFGERVLPLVEEVERAVLAVHAVAAADNVRVRLAVPSGFAALITRFLVQLRSAAPNVSLELSSGSKPVDLRRGDAELALRIGPITDVDLVAQNMGAVGWSLYGAESYLRQRPAPVDPRALAGHDVVGYDTSLADVPGAQWLDAHGDDANIVLRSRELTDMLAAATTGLGLAVLPCVLGDPEPSLRRLTDEVLGTRKLSLVYRRELLQVAAVRTVIEFVTRLLREQSALISGVAHGSSNAHRD